MSQLKRVLALGGLTSLLCALAFVAPGQASTFKAVCMFSSDTKAGQTKPVPAKYVQLIGGKGTFTFGSLPFVCVGVDLKTNTPIIESALTVTATGQFNNTVCGTGKVLGHITDIRGEVNPKANGLISEKFAIHFYGSFPIRSVGIFYWHKAAKGIPLPKPEDFDPFKDNPQGPKNYTVGGVIDLAPSRQAPKDNPFSELLKILNSPNKCTKSLTVSGTVLVHDGP